MNQLSRFRTSVYVENVDTAAKVEGSIADRHVVQLGPEIELVTVSAAMKAVKEPLG